MKSKKPLLITMFIVYCAAVAYVTLARSASAVFDTFGMLGTDGFMSYHELLSANLNLIPFFSFYNFIAMPVKTGIVVRGFFVNLFGNLLLFLPWGHLLPCISEKMRSAKRFFAVTSAVIICIELVQLFTLLGACDIEDYLLNIIGALIGFAASRRLIAKRAA